MNKKILFPVCLIILIGLAVFVSADMNLKTVNENKYTISIEVSKGWNLINGIYPPQQISQNSEIKENDIKVVWFYTPIENRYIEIYPNLDKTSIDNYDHEYVFSSAMWVYSEKSGTLDYDSIVYSDLPKLDGKNNFQLTAGWNFLTITPEFMGKSLNNLKGNCNIESAYVWDSGNQEWYLNQPAPLDEEFYQGAAVASQGEGVLIKVSSNCNLGTSGSSTSPPSLPN